MTETMVGVKVAYSLTFMGKVYIVENVPARVCKETGEQYFAPDTVEHIQALIKSNKRPDKIIETPMYEYA
jgi:YgiT-type zinc finger domain-containing protein